MSEEKKEEIIKCNECKGEALSEWFIGNKGQLTKTCLNCRKRNRLRGKEYYKMNRERILSKQKTEEYKIHNSLVKSKCRLERIITVNVGVDAYCIACRQKKLLSEFSNWCEGNRKSMCTRCLKQAINRNHNRGKFNNFQNIHSSIQELENSINERKYEVNDNSSYCQLCKDTIEIKNFSKWKNGSYKNTCDKHLEVMRTYKQRRFGFINKQPIY